MNKIKTHSTNHTCNACGSEVVDEYGRKRCSKFSCITNDRDNDLKWNSPEMEIRKLKIKKMVEAKYE